MLIFYQLHTLWNLNSLGFLYSSHSVPIIGWPGDTQYWPPDWRLLFIKWFGKTKSLWIHHFMEWIENSRFFGWTSRLKSFCGGPCLRTFVRPIGRPGCLFLSQDLATLCIECTLYSMEACPVQMEPLGHTPTHICSIHICMYSTVCVLFHIG